MKHQVYYHLHYRDPRKKREREENLFEKIWLKNLLNLVRESYPCALAKNPKLENPKTPTLRSYNQSVNKANIESKRKTSYMTRDCPWDHHLIFFPAETLNRSYHSFWASKSWKENFESRILYPARLWLRIGKIRRPATGKGIHHWEAGGGGP